MANFVDRCFENLVGFGSCLFIGMPSSVAIEVEDIHEGLSVECDCIDGASASFVDVFKVGGEWGQGDGINVVFVHDAYASLAFSGGCV